MKPGIGPINSSHRLRPPKIVKSKTGISAATGRKPADYEVLLPDGAPHVTGSIRVEDLLGDGSPQVLVTEPLRGEVQWMVASR